MELKRIKDFLYEIPREGNMRVPGRIYADSELVRLINQEQNESAAQVANVACLPGIVDYSLAMPDIHWGYGFPIGGVAAFDAEDGVISPGGVGYDINCGVRLMKTSLFEKDIHDEIKNIVRSLFENIPTGVGSSGAIPKLTDEQEKDLLTRGAAWAVENGYGYQRDLARIEDYGSMRGASTEAISPTAIKRGLAQMGTLGSGNHFVELARVTEIFDGEAAKAFGLEISMVTVMIHTGSRGFGYQICDDYVKKLIVASKKYGIELPDRQLACAPFGSPEGQEYFGAMRSAANYAFANRQVVMSLAEKAFAKAMRMETGTLGMELIYDVCHNIAKVEEHTTGNRTRRLVIHRKGATRAFGPGRPELSAEHRKTGQPVLIPGDMGRCSYLCVGTDEAMRQTFGSSCHGAGRVASRSRMLKEMKGKDLKGIMKDMGVYVMTQSNSSMAEEMPSAYKDVSTVVDVVHNAGIVKKVAKFSPLGVVKG